LERSLELSMITYHVFGVFWLKKKKPRGNSFIVERIVTKFGTWRAATKMKILPRLSGQMNESAHVGFTQPRRFAAENSGAVKIHWPILCNPACTARHTYHTKNLAPVGNWDGYNLCLSFIHVVELFCWTDLCSLERHTPYS
jgi:hypothetical protein